MRISIVFLLTLVVAINQNLVAQERNTSTFIHVEISTTSDKSVMDANVLKLNHTAARCNPYTLSGDSLLIDEDLVWFTVYDYIDAHLLVEYKKGIRNFLSSSFATTILYYQKREVPFYSMLDPDRKTPIFTITPTNLICNDGVDQEVSNDLNIITYELSSGIKETYKIYYYEKLLVVPNKKDAGLNCH